jgi:dephospho-CoA kinase
MDLQWSEEEKIALSDFVIHNDGTEEELRVSVTDIYNQLV